MKDPRKSTHQSSTKTLRRALTANAIFSGLTGAECLLFSGSVSRIVGLSQPEVFALGINLEIFSALLIFLATRRDYDKKWLRALVTAVIAMDVLWVIGSAAALLTPAAPFTTMGRWIVFGIALVVADIAYFQFRGLRGLRRLGDEMSAEAA